MELKEFISQTISAIADATSELQDKYIADDIIINPPSAQSGSDVYQPNSKNYTMRRVQNISFDVAVTASSENAGEGGAGIKVLSIDIGGKASVSNSAEQVSRVSFSVPITLKPSVDERKNVEQGKREKQQQDANFDRAMASRNKPGVV